MSRPSQMRRAMLPACSERSRPARSITPDRLAAAANCPGRFSASLNAPKPPIDRPATKVSSLAVETRKVRAMSCGSSSATQVQYFSPTASSV